MRNAPFWWIFLAILLILDWYVFQAIRTVTAGLPVRGRLIWHAVYWSITAMSILLVVLLPYFFSKPGPHYARSILFALVAGLFFAKLIASLFFLTDDLRRVLQWVGYQVLPKNKNVTSTDVLFSRSVFLSWAGLVAGAGLFSALSYGITIVIGIKYES